MRYLFHLRSTLPTEEDASGVAICVEGRRHTDFDSLMPIECKRLPTPKGDDRDEREYVFSEHTSTGGIQATTAAAQPGWTTKDLLNAEWNDVSLRLAVFRSSYERPNGLAAIELRHLWLEMNCPL